MFLPQVNVNYELYNADSLTTRLPCRWKINFQDLNSAFHKIFLDSNLFKLIMENRGWKYFSKI